MTDAHMDPEVSPVTETVSEPNDDPLELASLDPDALFKALGAVESVSQLALLPPCLLPCPHKKQHVTALTMVVRSFRPSLNFWDASSLSWLTSNHLTTNRQKRQNLQEWQLEITSRDTSPLWT